MPSSTDRDDTSRSASPSSGAEPNSEAAPGKTSSKTETKDKSVLSKSSKSSKDPSRPRRKKARRACHACQRAHLTCGDERPCQRCIKRGLAEQCCDGVRKKAKYLHDTPNEAFLPGGMNQYSFTNTPRHPSQTSQDVSYAMSTPSSEVFTQMSPQSANFTVYRPNTASTQVSQPILEAQQLLPPQSSGSVQFNRNQGQQGMQTLLNAAQQSMSADAAQSMSESFGTQYFDPNDISKFNFDPSTFNFGSHFGALEFGMLGHMATGAAETPPSDAGTQYNQNYASPVGVSGYAENPVRGRSYSMTQDQPMPDWQPPGSALPTLDAAGQVTTNADSRSHASRSRPLPAAIPINVSHVRDGSGRVTVDSSAPDLIPSRARGGSSGQTVADQYGFNSAQSSPQLTRVTTLSGSKAQPHLGSNRNPSGVYASTKQSYDYVLSWHILKNYFQKRFDQKTLGKVARALASIRPSFIAATRDLGTDDLIFQEKCFQRTLIMYQDFIADMCTPTIICRRTGEVAAVSSEFCELTGWSRDVLLGKEANLNENHALEGSEREAMSSTMSTAGPGAGSTSTTGTNTPRVVDAALDSSKLRPLYISELMDDASVVQFYQDFARMAFGEPRGRVDTRISVRRYRTKADVTSPKPNTQNGENGNSTSKFLDEFTSDEKFVDCACIWTIKRDPFETPMMVIMNFLPCL